MKFGIPAEIRIKQIIINHRFTSELYTSKGMQVHGRYVVMKPIYWKHVAAYLK
jgi:hypothetical protein